jgi:hypothetical protein
VHSNTWGEAEIKQKEKICRWKYDTHKIKWADRVKGKNPDTKTVGWVGWQPRVEKLRKKNWQNHELVNE